MLLLHQQTRVNEKLLLNKQLLNEAIVFLLANMKTSMHCYRIGIQLVFQLITLTYLSLHEHIQHRHTHRPTSHITCIVTSTTHTYSYTRSMVQILFNPLFISFDQL